MRIGIIGAGISGLSAAHSLMKKGYRDICVIEGSERVGGKCCTVEYQGKTYEMGAIMGLPSHQRLQRLMKKFHIRASDMPLTRGHYSVQGKLSPQLAPELRLAFVEQIGRLPEVLKGYPWLCGVGFAGCPEALMQPFDQWCKSHDLEVLISIYEQCFTTFGFGDIACVPAAYVLKVISYENLMGFLELSRVITWPKGTGALLQRMADQVPELRLTQSVQKIEVAGSGKIQVTLSSGTEVFDRLIFTGDMTQLPRLMPVEPAMLPGLEQVCTETFHVSAFRLKGIPELCGYVPDNLKAERRGHLTVWYNRWPSGADLGLVTAYAYRTPLGEAHQIQLLKEDLEKLGCEQVQLFQSRVWNHFPHLGCNAMKAGFYNAVEAQQGQHGIYFGGELLAGPSMENCVAYSEYLIDQYF